MQQVSGIIFPYMQDWCKVHGGSFVRLITPLETKLRIREA
jgi:hypothetical protein